MMANIYWALNVRQSLYKQWLLNWLCEATTAIIPSLQMRYNEGLAEFSDVSMVSKLGMGRAMV